MNNKKFIDDIPAAIISFPKLQAVTKGDITILMGEIDLVQSGILEDSYLVEIHPTKDYPKRFPKVFEVGGRLPINPDWHVMLDGSLCIAAPPDEIIACSEGMVLSIFLEKWVKPYFYNQTYRRKNGFFYKERSHGNLGILESYQEILGTKNVSNIIKVLHYAATHSEPERTSICFCDSGKKYRKCHRGIFRKLKKIDNITLLMHANSFKELH